MSTATFSNGLRDRSGDQPPPPRGGLPHRRLILASAACLMVGALVVWMVAFSSLFGVRSVHVDGVLPTDALHALTAEQVVTAAGVSHGTPLVRLDTGAVQRRIEELPEVASARVSTSFPSTVSITVTERVALGVVRSSAGYVLVDRTGDQYRTVRVRPSGLPLFVVPAGTSNKTTGGAVATVALALGAPLRKAISSIQALDPQAISVLMSDGVVVAWGSADQSTLKARILGALLMHAHGHSAPHLIDVSDPNAPFTR